MRVGSQVKPLWYQCSFWQISYSLTLKNKNHTEQHGRPRLATKAYTYMLHIIKIIFKKPFKPLSPLSTYPQQSSSTFKFETCRRRIQIKAPWTVAHEPNPAHPTEIQASSFTYVLSMDFFILLQQKWAVAAKVAWPKKAQNVADSCSMHKFLFHILCLQDNHWSLAMNREGWRILKHIASM
jgi:hypothetical protein